MPSARFTVHYYKVGNKVLLANKVLPLNPN